MDATSNRWRTAWGRAAALARRLGRDTSGLVAIEAAYCLPLLFAVLFGGTVTYDVVRTRDRLEAASSTVADMLSRADSVDTDDLDELAQFQAYLSGTEMRDLFFRVIAVERQTDDRGTANTADDKRFNYLRWTYIKGRGTIAPPHDTKKVWHPKLPTLIPDGEMAMLIKVTIRRKPFSLYGWATPERYEHDTVVLPRYNSFVPNTDLP